MQFYKNCYIKEGQAILDQLDQSSSEVAHKLEKSQNLCLEIKFQN